MSSVVLFRTQHWRPTIDRPTILRSSHAQSSSTAIHLVNLVSSSIILVSSRLCQPRLVYVNPVSSMSTPSRPCQPLINVVPTNLFPLSVVMSGEYVVSCPFSYSTYGKVRGIQNTSCMCMHAYTCTRPGQRSVCNLTRC